MASKKPTAAKPQALSGNEIAELLAKAEEYRQRLLEKPGNELTRAQALGTWTSFFGDYGAYRHLRTDDFHRKLLREAMVVNHKAATDYLIRLAHDNGIKDGTALHHAGELCRQLANQQELRDPDAETHLWPTCLGKHRYDLPQAQQEVIEAGESVIQQLRLKLYAPRGSETDDSANSASASKLFLGDVPKNTDLVDLAVLLDAEKSKPESEQRSWNEIARTFTNEIAPNDNKAKSLLASLRRMKRSGCVNL